MVDFALGLTHSLFEIRIWTTDVQIGRGNSASGEQNAGSQLAAVECKELCASLRIQSPTDHRREQSYGVSELEARSADVRNDRSSAEYVTICRKALPLE